MPLSQPITQPLPTLEEAFGGRPSLMTALHQANIESIIPVMLLPREVLWELPDIDQRTTRYISNTLRLHGLVHRDLCEPLKQYVNRAFGGIESAPVQVLSVVIGRIEDAPHPFHWPLRVLAGLSEFESNMTVADMIRLGRVGIREQMDRLEGVEMEADAFANDIDELNWRLAWWDASLSITGLSAPIRHLRPLS